MVRIISSAISKNNLIDDNDPILSGILDLENVHQNVVTLLNITNHWKEVKGDECINFRIPIELRSWVTYYITSDRRYNIPTNLHGKDFELFIATQTLINWLLQYRSRNINKKEHQHESTWSHDMVDPIIKFLLWDIHSISWEW